MRVQLNYAFEYNDVVPSRSSQHTGKGKGKRTATDMRLGSERFDDSGNRKYRHRDDPRDGYEWPADGGSWGSEQRLRALENVLKKAFGREYPITCRRDGLVIGAGP